MGYSLKEAEDRLFLIDASFSMNRKVGGRKRIDIVREGLKSFCLEKWPIAYYEWPLRIGIIAFHLLGTPGRTVFDVLVPLNPTPPHLELFRLDELKAKGGSPLYEGFRYAYHLMLGSTRGRRRVKFIGDGDIEGPDPSPILEEMVKANITTDSIELSEKPSELMMGIAKKGGGKYYCVRSLEEFTRAIRE